MIVLQLIMEFVKLMVCVYVEQNGRFLKSGEDCSILKESF